MIPVSREFTGGSNLAQVSTN